MDKQNQFYEIDVMQLLRALWNRVWIIILVALLGAAGMFGYSTFGIAPLYKSEILLYVNNSSFSVGSTSFSISSSEISAAERLVDTYLVILKARATLDVVSDVLKEEHGLNYSSGSLKGMLSAGSVNGTEIFRVTATCSKPKDAEIIANTVAEVLPNKIADIVDGSSVEIVDWAVVPTAKSSPNITRYTTMGLLVGAALACAVIIILEITDSQIHNEDYLLETYDLPVLAVIPNLDNKSAAHYYSKYYQKYSYGYGYKADNQKGGNK